MFFFYNLIYIFLQMIDRLASGYGSDPEITKLVDKYDWKFVPILNAGRLSLFRYFCSVLILSFYYADGYAYSWSHVSRGGFGLSVSFFHRNLFFLLFRIGSGGRIGTPIRAASFQQSASV